MSLACVPIAVNAVEEIPLALERARRAQVLGARLVEWRCDGLASCDGAFDAVMRLVREAPIPAIVTVRSEDEGGSCALAENERLALLARVARGPGAPRMVDVEHASLSSDLARSLMLAAAGPRDDAGEGDQPARIVGSTHDFDGRPADLTQRFEALQHDPLVSVAKLAWMARSVRDNLEAFELLGMRSKPTIALCMGEFGLMSRVLAPKFGGFLTFASDAEGTGTAPGQLSIRELRDLYRFGAVGPATRVFGVVGWPVAHSRSPAFHNARFAEKAYDGVYLPIPVPAAWEHFKATLGALVDHEKLDFAGASVTIPHKEHLVRFVAERGGTVDADAAWLGAANTLVVHPHGTADAQRLYATNTDMPAAVEVLSAALATRGVALAGARVAVFGAGGVARAVAGGLALAGATVVVFNRSRERAEALAAALGGRAREGGRTTRVIAGNDDHFRCNAPRCECFHALVNCTPLGMEGGPDPKGSPMPDDAFLDDATVVMDTVYAPKETPFLREARARGAVCVDGEAMFLRQAELQSELFLRRW
ncbi:MAG: type I 3-dehydroquinate dehydratase [Planctomycetaceae bacterium]|nr:type I 3-dehydroquinate dehydratase [Planctomycetaceae bacterium]